MASIVLRGPKQFQATVRKAGCPRQTRTFESKRLALSWVSMVELEMDRSVFVDRRESQRTTLGELISKYAEEVTVKKRGFRPEQSRIKRLLTHSNSLLRLSQLGSDVFSKYRDERLKYGVTSLQEQPWGKSVLWRVYCQLKLNLPRRGKKRLPLRIKQSLEASPKPNQGWSCDFMSDALWSGRRFRTFNVIDEN